MIINWYSTHIDPDKLPPRLAHAYALWMTVRGPQGMPSLQQVEASTLYDDLSPYMLMTENQGDADSPKLVFVKSGAKVVELYGTSVAGKPVDEVLTRSGRSLAGEVFALLRSERKPVHLSVSGSPVVKKDVQGIVIPIRSEDPARESAILVYDF